MAQNLGCCLMIVGIRPGLAESPFSWCVLKIEGLEACLVERGAVRLPRHKPVANRLAIIRKALHEVLTKYESYDGPRVACIESRFEYVSPTVALKLAEAKGVALLTSFEYNFEPIEIDPHTVQNTLRNFDNSDLSSCVFNALKLKPFVADDSVIKAMAVAITGWHMLQKPNKKKPAKEAYQEGSYSSTYGLKWV